MSEAAHRSIDLRWDWNEVRRKVALGVGGEGGGGVAVRPQATPHASTTGTPSLEELDPTQRVFADRVLAWAREVFAAYKEVRSTGTPQHMPLLRSWLCGSVGSGKSATLKAIVRHVRHLFQQEGVAATVELTAYTGVAAFNIGFGARTACSGCPHLPQRPMEE